jgi:glycosyltransferase involved in cell wall biosynthesis
LKQSFIFWINYYFRIARNADRLQDIIERLNIDVLYMNNQPSLNLEGILAARNAGILSVQHSRTAAELNTFEVNAVNKWLNRMICVSEGVRETFVGQGVNASICDVVYNGIAQNTTPVITASEIREKWGVREDEILIGTVGSLMRRKRINDLIEAMAVLEQRVKGQMSRVKGMIVGDGPERGNLQKQVLELGLQGKVIFTGFHGDAISYVNAMDIFVLPSEREGLPRVILEAMLMSKPVIACNTTGSSELVVDGETGFLVPVKEPEIMANAISKLIASADLRKKMGQNGKTIVLKRFSIESYVSGINKILEEVLR